MQNDSLQKLRTYYDNLPEEVRQKYDNMESENIEKEASELSKVLTESDIGKMNISPELFNNTKTPGQKPNQKTLALTPKEAMKMKNNIKIKKEGTSCVVVGANGIFRTSIIPIKTEKDWIEGRLGKGYVKQELSEYETVETIGNGLVCYYNPTIKARKNKFASSRIKPNIKGAVIFLFENGEISESFVKSI